MHVAEGIFPLWQATLWAAIATPFVVSSASQMKRRLCADTGVERALLGIAGALIFAVTLFPVPVPIAGATSHLCATPVLALLLGLRSRQRSRGRDAPAGWLTDWIDFSMAPGLMVLRELSQRREAATVRLGLTPGQPRLATYGMSLAGGVERAFDRSVALNEVRMLRSAKAEKTPAGNEPIATFQDVSVAYPDGTVGIDTVSLTLDSGCWVAVAGPSGSGKSTLLRVLSGLLPPHAGELRRFGRILTPGAVAGRIDQRVALVFQDPNDQLLGSTPLEDLVWGLLRWNVPEVQAYSKALGMLEALGFPHLAQRPIHHLSLGERKRVAFAAALVCEPELLLCDEPTSSLDPVAARQLVAVLERVTAARRVTVVWVTHDCERLPQRISRVILLRAGRVVFDGAKHEAPLPPWLMRAGLDVADQVDETDPPQSGTTLLKER